MLQETEFKIENLQRLLIDIDITQSDSWVGVTGYLESEYAKQHEIPFGSHINFGDKSYNLPKEMRNPFVRSINEKTALVLGVSKQYDENDQRNAWITTSSGEVKANFSVGDAIEDIVITKDFVVVTYFDEAACYGEGLVVFDFEGNQLFGYEELLGKESAAIYDCYAVVLVKENQIIFCSYTEFPLVLFDIETKTQQVWETPAVVHGFSAISKLADKIYFHHSYDDRFGIYAWQIGSKNAEKIGEHSNYFVRGLPNGKFLSRNDSGYSIISPQQFFESLNFRV